MCKKNVLYGLGLPEPRSTLHNEIQNLMVWLRKNALKNSKSFPTRGPKILYFIMQGIGKGHRLPGKNI